MRLKLTVVAVLAAAFFTGSASAADLAVSNAGQVGAESTTPQAPAVVASRGACANARTVDEANGGPTSCPAGTWPEQGAWTTPIVDAIVGDTLTLAFSAAQDSVQVTVTTSYPIGLRTPPCPVVIPSCIDGDQAVPNTGVVLSATPTLDAKRWELVLPPTVQGGQGAVTAVAGGVGENYALGLSSPRWVDESTKCGLAYFAPGDARVSCPAQEGKIKGSFPPPDLAQPQQPSGPEQVTAPNAAVFKLRTATKLHGRHLSLRFSSSAKGKLAVVLRRAKKDLLRRSVQIGVADSKREIRLTDRIWRQLAAARGKQVQLRIIFQAADGTRSTTSRALTWKP